MIRRLALLALVASGLSPGLVWRDAPAPADPAAGVALRRLDPGQSGLGPFAVEGVWELASSDSRFGGSSGLAAIGRDRLLAVSDDARVLTIDLDSAGLPRRFVLGDFLPDAQRTTKGERDVESLTRDPATGRLWAGYEGRNAIERRDADLALESARTVRPAAMRGWGDNSGPESLTRLPDGRFIALSEGPRRMFGAIHAAVLFPHDPTEDAAGVRFSLRMPEGYDPADMAALPDGRVLILGRKVSLIPPGFRNIVLLADPAAIRAGREWSGRILAHIAPPFPTDNYEGLAVMPAPQGGYPVTLWLISDDNQAQYQRTLLAKLRWDGVTR